MNCTRILGPTDIKYKIICAGNKFDIGCSKLVTVEYNGKRYQAKMHSKTKGRIDGLGAMYSDFHFVEGQKLQLSYDSFFNLVKIQTESGTDVTDEIFHTMFDTLPEYETIAAPKFNGEYYNSNRTGYKKILRTIAKYGDTLYFMYHGSVYTCKDAEMQDRIELVKAHEIDMDLEIFVNEYGIFVYKCGCDRGEICRLYSHDGKERGCFKITRKGRMADSHIITAAYIKDNTFYCVSDKAYYVYKFASEDALKFEACSDLDKEDVTGICVGEEQVYLRIGRDWEKQSWYKLETDKTLCNTVGNIEPVVNTGNTLFVHPEKGVAWINAGKEGTNYVLQEVRLADGRTTGRKNYVCAAGLDSKKYTYFDGTYMYLTDSSGDFSSVNLQTGEICNERALFEANKILVADEKLYITVDSMFMKHNICSISMNLDFESIKKITSRLW